MTIKELKEKLNEFDENLNVFLPNCEYGFGKIRLVIKNTYSKDFTDAPTKTKEAIFIYPFSKDE